MNLSPRFEQALQYAMAVHAALEYGENEDEYEGSTESRPASSGDWPTQSPVACILGRVRTQSGQR